MSANTSNGYLTYHDGPLVWIDCEMTGPDYQRDNILEIAVSAVQQRGLSGSHLFTPRYSLPTGTWRLLMTA